MGQVGQKYEQFKDFKRKMEILYPPKKKWGKNAIVTETNAFASVISEPNAVTCRISDFGG